VGLDPDLEKLPKSLKNVADPIYEFNRQIIDATHDLVCSYKPNIAFYESSKSLESLQKTVKYIHESYPDTPVICDAKRGDIASTSMHYAQTLFDQFDFDAATVNPYLGFDSIEPFLNYKDKGTIILCRTSNSGAADFQDLLVNNEPIFVKVARSITQWDKQYGNCLMVVGATWPDQLRQVRQIAPHMDFLVPGVGSQGGDLEATVKAGVRTDKAGLIINASRSIIYAGTNEDFASKAREEAQKLRDQINNVRSSL